MTKHFTFSAGPAMAPAQAVRKFSNAIISVYSDERLFPDMQHLADETAFSIAGISHRGKEFAKVVYPDVVANFKSLLGVPDDYLIVFKAGGATAEFHDVVGNLNPNLVTVLETGNWSKKAAKVMNKSFPGIARSVNLVSDDKRSIQDYTLEGIASVSGLSTNDFEGNHFYVAANETIQGLQYPDLSKLPGKLIVDMSSELFTREFSWDNIDVAYACAQKCFGAPGWSVIIAKKDALDPIESLPDRNNYLALEKGDSALNTPPTDSIYFAGAIAQWIKENGGANAMKVDAVYRSGLLYNAIDESNGFYSTVADPLHASKCNVPFLLKDSVVGEFGSPLEKKFLEEATEAGLHELKGYRTVGGMRASMYPGMPREGAERLAEFMIDFAKDN